MNDMIHPYEMLRDNLLIFINISRRKYKKNRNG